MNDYLDLDRFPLDQPERKAYAQLLQQCRDDLAARGMFNLDGLVREAALADEVAALAKTLSSNAHTHRKQHNIYFADAVDGLAPEHPALRQALTSNRKICGDQMEGRLMMRLYGWPPLARFLAEVMEKPALFTMDDPLACVNVMAYGDGEALNWHFDRSEFTTTLLLQAPDAGGVFQYRTGLRSDEAPNYDGVGRFLSGEDGAHEEIALSPGTLNVFRGKNTAHRVSPVVGARERMIAVFSYYEQPGARFSQTDQRRFYGRVA
ncbi:MAG: 2OG-Fe(II) oxygenase [Pseudomonadota bacterium]